MNAEVINPWTWQEQYGFVHGVAVPSGARTVYVAGQAAVDDQASPRSGHRWTTSRPCCAAPG
jgi:hypothetical protein